MKNKQAEIAQMLTSRQLQQQLYLSQAMIVLVTLLISFFLFDSFGDWVPLFKFAPKQLFWYGVLPGLSVVLIDLLLMRYLPEKYYDDGGINKKIFQNQTIFSIFMIAFVVSVVEEMLFRGVIHTEFGYVIASTLFAVVHVRYLTKPVLLVSVFLLSFYLGLMFEWTNNLLVTIVAHFIIDFCLGLSIQSHAERRRS
ncbi:CPBP family intramembrane glutamic endopeptidase [Aquibacillus salsiterrae]|uniref:CPBP family intramembrane metalloprotease n=1 Tax=Aquibacillus salsiterrae TaxID=2950439 RepID=A0A9X3WB98_9BACI|nr:CPBP family intramembrane glutamic endopeptidase [Aquibacillus salsiterrae]MDC3415408.1 CPBP family intramembrane metalloprotease [Aquibacillus salsiterrae]